MSDDEFKKIYPFTAFNFSVEIEVPGFPDKALCGGAFAECDGLEMTMDVKTIREGGNNTQQVRLTGAVNYGTLTLKRGMTGNYDLWKWFGKIYEPGQGGLRARTTVVVHSADHTADRATFVLTGCLPVKLKAPPLSGKDGMVAIEELQVAYETMRFSPPSA